MADWVADALVHSRQRRGQSTTGAGSYYVRGSAPMWFPDLVGSTYAASPDPYDSATCVVTLSESLDEALSPPRIDIAGPGTTQRAVVPPFDACWIGAGTATPHPRLIVVFRLLSFFGADRQISVVIEDGAVVSVLPIVPPEPDVEVELPYSTYLSVRSGALGWREAVSRQDALVQGTASSLLAAVGLVARLERLAPVSPAIVTDLARVSRAIAQFDVHDSDDLEASVPRLHSSGNRIRRVHRVTLIEAWGLRRGVFELDVDTGPCTLWTSSVPRSLTLLSSAFDSDLTVRLVTAGGAEELTGEAARARLAIAGT